jgi:uncharacterized protein
MSSSSIGANCIVFGRVLRDLGLGAQPDRVLLFEQALAQIGFCSREDVKEAGRCAFVRTPDERRRFDAAFDAFWSALPPGVAPDREEPGTDAEREKRQSEKPRPAAPDGEAREGQPTPDTLRSVAPPSQARLAENARLINDGDRSFTYSFAEALGRKEFSQLADDELAKRRRLELGMRRSRRSAPGRGGTFDPRRTMRASLRQYGEALPLHTREPRLRHRDVVLLCDISGSMDRYSRLLLQFIHVMRHTIGKVEAFVFGTRLTRITRALRQPNFGEAQRAVAATVADWGGGTRIGECLREFNVHWARRVLARGAIVIIISDGWDRGDIGLLAREMRRLQRSSYRLIWLNPLLGSKGYRPQTLGMQAALPYIDDFLPAHNLKSLVQLIVALRTVDRRRPVRAQVKEAG